MKVNRKFSYKKLLNKAKTDHGFSINRDGAEPTSGYMVSLQGYEIIVSPSMLNSFMLKACMDSLKKEPTLADKYIGCWYNTESDRYYFDISVNIKDKNEALELAVKNRQVALYDVTNDCYIGNSGFNRLTDDWLE